MALSELKHQHKLCKDKKEADRLKAIYLLGKGWSTRAIEEALLLDDSTIRNYFKLYKEKGIKGLLENSYKGKASYLTEVEMKLLEIHLQEHTYSRVSEIIEYVSNEFEVDYTDSGMRGVLKQLNFVYKKPEKIPYRVDEEAQNFFVKRYKKIKKGLSKIDGLYFMDAVHPEHNPIPAHGWIKRGETKVVKTNPRPYRLNINGAININTLDMVVRFEERINKESTLDFLSALRKHQPKGRIYLICDNAGYYQAPDVKVFAAGLAIELIYLPPYSPNLNLIERVWKFFKKKILYNQFYEEFDEMRNAAKNFFCQIGNHQSELRSLLTENFQIITV